MCSMLLTIKDITTGRREKLFNIHFLAGCNTTAAFSSQNAIRENCGATSFCQVD